MAMIKQNFATIDDLAKGIIKIDNAMEDDHSIEVIGHYGEIKDLFECLIRRNYHVGCVLDLQDYMVECYDREYDLSISDGGEVSVEKEWHDANQYCKEGYFICDADVVFVFDDCNCSVLKMLYTDQQYEISIGEDEEAEPEEQKPQEKPKQTEKAEKETSKTDKKDEDDDLAEFLKEIGDFLYADRCLDFSVRPIHLFDTWPYRHPFIF